MAIGDWHALDNGRYVFRETLHGPFVATSCVDCGGECYVVQQTGRINAHGLPEDTASTVRPRCSTCGRRRWGAPVKLHADRPRVQHGIGFPGRLDPERLSRTAEVKAAAAVRKGLVEEWSLTDARLPAGPRGFIEDLARAGIMGARVCHTVALKPDGQLSETIGVHWGGGRAFWTRSDQPASVTRRKVDLKRTKTGRRKIQRFDPIVTPARTVWTGEVYAPMRMTVTQAILAIRQRTGT